MSKDLASHKKRRQFTRKSITDIVKHADEQLQKENNHERISILKTNIEAKAKELNDTQASICEMIEEDEINDECDMHGQYEMRIVECLAKINKYLLSSQVNNESVGNFHVKSDNKSPQVKLPKIDLPVFQGDVLMWEPYYQSIKVSVIDNGSLADVQKLEYIMRTLKGAAAEAVKGYAIVQENYQPVLNTLKERYGQSRLIVEAHVKSLIHMPVLKSEEGNVMRKFYDKVVCHIRSIGSMGEKCKPDNLAPVLVPLIVDKLPKSIIEKWEFHVKDSKENYIPIKKLTDFLEQMIRAKESSQSFSLEKKDEENEKPKGPFQSSRQFHQRRPTVSSLNASVQGPSCVFCNKNHHIKSCVEFLSLMTRERHQKAKQNRLCFLCLEAGHTADSCEKPLCKHCKGRHHNLLHMEFHSKSVGSPQAAGKDNKVYKQEGLNVQSTTANTNGETIGKVILQTIPAILWGENGLTKRIRCFFDPGSQTSFIRQGICDELGLDGKGVRVAISGFGGYNGKTSIRKKIPFQLSPINKQGNQFAMEALTAKIICQPIEPTDIDPASWSHLKDIAFVEKFPRLEEPIDVLVGMDYYYLFITRDMVRGNFSEPIAVRSTLGWILCGPVSSNNSENVVSMHVQVLPEAEKQLNDTLKQFWELEAVGIRDDQEKVLVKDDEVMWSFTNSLKFQGDRYMVSLPWKEDGVRVKDNFDQAKHRLINLEKKLMKSSMLEVYSEAIDKYVQEGIAEEVPANEIVPKDGRQVFYLPHHVVIRNDSSTTKARVVFDGSAQDENGVSLNDCIHPGPPLQPDLVGILLRFRKNQIAIVGDIQKMFLQILLDEKDRDVHRYLWRNMELDNAPKIYRMTRVTFGIVASPFLAIGTIYEHAKKNQELFSQAAKEILRNTYVDDIVTGKDEEDEAIQLQEDLKNVMKLGNFNVTKWASNSLAVMKNIPKEDQAVTSNPIDLHDNTGENSQSKALGLQWKPQKDVLSFGYDPDEDKVSSEQVTKRQVLSQSARVFDPLGLISPFVVRSKILFQKLWTHGLGWDDEIPPEFVKIWHQYLLELRELKELQVPRCYTSMPINKYDRLELHGFGDASEDAYAGVVYLRATTSDGHVETALITSKSRVAPVKKISLPRLELMGALITARLCTYVSSMLDCSIDRIMCWTDNTPTLCWIRGSASKWKQFVSNRVSEIQSLIAPAAWNYCPGKDNPADLPSRGISAHQLMESELWWKGPVWLRRPEEEWPKLQQSISSEKSEDEKKTAKIVSCVTTGITESVIDFSRFNKYSRLLNTVAWIKRFATNARLKKEERRFTPLNASELEESELWLLHQIQNSYFSEELCDIRQKKSISKNSKLVNLNPCVLPVSGLLCVGGRIHKSLLSEEEKHPIILPSESHVVKMLVMHTHNQLLHAGVEHTLSVLRQKYWILKGRSVVRQVKKTCVICRHYNTKPMSQRMAPLPTDRVQPVPPFTNVGLDFAGPLHLTDYDKAYICLFTCAVTRALHIELVGNMSTETFLLALRRMVSRRGMCSIIWSDNAKTFKAANKHIQKCWRVIEDPQTQVALAEKKIKWKFIVEKAPWWGGFYERLVKSIKTPLKKLFSKVNVNFEQMSTILAEIEAQINSRPLTYVSSDPNDLGVLTPAQILVGRSLQPFPITEISRVDHTAVAMTSRWLYRRRLVNNFWRRWSSEYLKSLNSLKKWTDIGKEVKVGDIVLISEDRVPRGRWVTARVENIHQGRDGLVRAASLKTTAGKILRRPVQRLHLLESTDADTSC